MLAWNVWVRFVSWDVWDSNYVSKIAAIVKLITKGKLNLPDLSLKIIKILIL